MKRGLKHEMIFCGGALSAFTFLIGQKKLATHIGLASLALLAWPEETWSPENKLVVITGGSRGLGFALAREFASRGARLALIARDEFELEEAKSRLLHEFALLKGSDVEIFACDITEQPSFAQTLIDVVETCGAIDAFINNAGSIIVGPLETMSEVDFQNHFNLHLRPVLQSTHFLTNHFGKKGGRIVNISSIGGRIAVPHMSPYVTTKFALGGFSETSAAELAARGIRVTTVYPGLMQTGSPPKALFKGSPAKEYAWFSASDTTPGLSMLASTAAKKIADGVCAGNTRLTITWAAKLGNFGYSMLPEIFGAIMRVVSRFLPQGSDQTITIGHDARAWVDTKAWYSPFKSRLRDLESELNQ